MDSNNQMTPARRRAVRGTLLAFAVLAAVAGLLVLTVVPPTDSSIYPRCQLFQLTGWHCPGCGTTRAVHAALNGRVEQAVAYNPLVFVTVPIVAITIIQSLWAWAWDDRTIRTTDGRPSWYARRGPIVLAFFFVAFGVLRNVPIYPFTLLAPHDL